VKQVVVEFALADFRHLPDVILTGGITRAQLVRDLHCPLSAFLGTILQYSQGWSLSHGGWQEVPVEK